MTTKTLTPEIRERIKALYHGQEIALYRGHLYNTVGNHNPEDVLEVRSLANITDEEAIEVGRLFEYAGKITKWQSSHFKEVGRDYIEDSAQDGYKLRITDYLRSRGFALPAYGFTVEELVELGIFKLKTHEQ